MRLLQALNGFLQQGAANCEAEARASKYDATYVSCLQVFAGFDSSVQATSEEVLSTDTLSTSDGMLIVLPQPYLRI